jgi:hypothetical protein
MRTQVDTTQKKKKQKQTMKRKSGKDHMQGGLMGTKSQSMIAKMTSNKRAIICHKSTSDEGALTMMCEHLLV